jgi:hypothetical protein
MMLTALFLAVPLELRDLGLATANHWMVYVPVMLVSMGLMVPFVILAEKRRQMKTVLLGAVAALAAAQCALYLFSGLAGIVAAMVLFFVAFNLLEATLPSLVAKTAPAAAKGTAMGFFTTWQFFGAFAGGLLGGVAHHSAGINGVFLLGAGAAVVWWLVAAGMSEPRYLSTRLVHVDVADETAAERLTAALLQVPGVAEAAVVVEEGAAYLKVDAQALDEQGLQRLV